MTDFLVSLPGETLRHALGAVPAGVALTTWDLTGPPPAAHLDIVVPPYMSGGSALHALAGVTTGLVQGQSIGYDHVVGNLPAGHVFANAKTVHETSTAELALGLIIASQRGIDRAVRSAAEGRWDPFRAPSLADRRVLIVGYGGVGEALDTRLRASEALVTRVARTARESANGHVHGFDELGDLLPNAEIVVLTVPLTPETHGFFDRAVLASLAPGTLVVNVARGDVLDPDALLHEAQSGRLRFALDVTSPEPLPDHHPLFALDNVLLTAHVGGATSAMMPRMGALLRRQIGHLIAGEPWENVVLRT